MDIYRIYMCIQYISESTPAMFVKFWKWILIFNSICALISCIISEETNSETFKVLQLPFGESCLHQLIDLRVIPLSKVDADFLKMTTTKANHPPPTQMRLWDMCMTFCAANNFWLSKRLQMILKYQSAYAIKSELMICKWHNCQRNLCPSSESEMAGWSHDKLQGKNSLQFIHILSNHWWSKNSHLCNHC